MHANSCNIDSMRSLRKAAKPMARLSILQAVSALLQLALVRGQDCPAPEDTPGSSSCLQSAGGTIPFEDLGRGATTLPSGAQVIIPSYTFRCCGTITHWRTFMEPGGGMEDYDITFQVWRPSSSALPSSGCYSLVGENAFSGVDLDRGGLVCESVPAGSGIRVQPGDVVGYLSTHARGRDGGVQLDDSVESETVWYALDAQRSGDPQCLLSVGSQSGRQLQSFTDHAPVLSVTLDVEECPSAGTTSTTDSPSTTTITLPPVSPPPTPSSPPLPNPSFTTTTNSVDKETGDLYQTTKSHQNPEPETSKTPEPGTSKTPEPGTPKTPQDTAPFSEVMTLPTGTSNTSSVNPISPGQLSTNRLIGIVFGSLAMLVLLAVINLAFIVATINHCRKKRRDKKEKVLHSMLDATLSYNNIYNHPHSEIVLLDHYSNTKRLSEDYDYATPHTSIASLSLSGTTLLAPPATHGANSTCYYVQPTKEAHYDKLGGPHYNQPRATDHYDRPNRMSPQMLVAPYAIGSASLRSALSTEGGSDLSSHHSNEYITRNTNFNVVTNEAYAVTQSSNPNRPEH